MAKGTTDIDTRSAEEQDKKRRSVKKAQNANARARAASGKSVGNGNVVTSSNQNRPVRGARSQTRIVTAAPYRSQIEKILGSDTDTINRVGKRLSDAIDKVATKHNWSAEMRISAFDYAIKLVQGEGDVDPSKLDKVVHRTVEKRFATTVWYMRHQLAERSIFMPGTFEPFFKGDYEAARQYANA